MVSQPDIPPAPPTAPSPTTRATGTPTRRAVIALVGLMVLALGLGVAVLVRVSGPADGRELTYRARRGNLVVSITEQGTLESSNNTEIKCQVRGFSTVTSVVNGGTEVKQGDLLVRLDTKRLEDEIGRQTTDAHVARAVYERTKADVANAEMAIDAYLNGRYQTQLKGLEQQLEAAQNLLNNARKDLKDSEALFLRSFVSRAEVESLRFNLKNAELDLKVRQTAIDTLNNFTRKMELTTLKGNLRSLQSKLKADEAGLRLDEGRRDRAIREREFCEIVAPRDGLVIYPSAAAWKSTPDVAEGVNVRKDQVLLLMPDLSQMQVKVGIHESIVDRLSPGMQTRVVLPEFEVEGRVSSVASVAKPAGWWTGNVVKYDTLVELPPTDQVKPGMSAEVEIILEQHADVLLIPVSSVVDTEQQSFCWVKTKTGVERRVVELGASDEVMIIVNSGIEENEQVVLDPAPYAREVETELLTSTAPGSKIASLSSQPQQGKP